MDNNLTDIDWTEVGKAVHNINETFKKLTEAIINALYPVSKTCTKLITGILYPLADGRVVYLAKHGKNARIRKKNHKRALKQGFKRLNEGAEKWKQIK